jgi:hypothetical protein
MCLFAALTRFFFSIVVCMPLSLLAQRHKDASVVLPSNEIRTIFSDSIKKAFKIGYPIYRAYKYADSSGQYYCVLTESNDSFTVTDEHKPDTAHYSIRAVDLKMDHGKMSEVWEINDFILKNGNEISIWFWSKYCAFQDFDKDGLIEPIIVYGTHSMDAIIGNRVKFIIYYKGRKIAIRHQDSDLDEGRHTEVDKAFHNLPQKLRDAVKEKMVVMHKSGLSIFDKMGF